MKFEIELRTNTDCFIAAYYKNCWVAVPLFYIPQEAIGEDGHLHSYSFVPLDGEELPKSSESLHKRKEFDIDHLVGETILPWRLSKKDLKKLCTDNDISEYWVTGHVRSFSNSALGLTRREKRKNLGLEKKDYKKFISKLRKLSEQSVVIAEILWFINRQLREGGSYITLAEVLRMRVRDVDPEDGIATCIRLKRTGQQNRHELFYSLPEYIWGSLCKLIKKDSVFVFSSKNLGPLLSGDVTEHFKKAGKQAGIKGTVCSLSLRPFCSEYVPKRDLDKYIKNPMDESNLQEITLEEWGMLCDRIPSLKGGKGRAPKHDPRAVFNAIIYHERTGTPYRKLPFGRSVHSQFLRWDEKGIINAVLQARK